MKTKTTLNVVLIVLMFLLLISIGFGINSYFTANDSKEDHIGITIPEAQPSVLVNGGTFNALVPDNATSIEFVAGKAAPADAVDVSEAQNGSIMAWMEDTTFYVVEMKNGMIYANSDSSYMFKDKTNLAHINTENLDMSQVKNASYLFSNCNNLTNTISDFNLSNVELIPYAFENCTWLTEFNVPSSISDIGINAFYNCTNLTNVTFDNINNLTSIGEAAFFSTALTEFNVPASVTSIGIMPFANCTNLKAINVDADNIYYSSQNGTLYDKNKTTLIQYPSYNFGGYYNILYCVKTIETGAFYGCSLIDITMPQYLKRINSYAFVNCPKLTTIVFSKYTNEFQTIIKNYAFDNCSKLKTITYQGYEEAWNQASKRFENNWDAGLPSDYQVVFDPQ